jgi:hypothetical protein
MLQTKDYDQAWVRSLFGMDLEFLLRQKPKWKVALQDILFTEGDIVKRGEEGEKAEDQEG